MQWHTQGQHARWQLTGLQYRLLYPLDKQLDATAFHLRQFTLKAARAKLQIILIPTRKSVRLFLCILKMQ